MFRRCGRGDSRIALAVSVPQPREMIWHHFPCIQFHCIVDVGDRWPFLKYYSSGGIGYHFIGNDVSEPTFTAVGAEGDEIGPGGGIIVCLSSDRAGRMDVGITVKGDS